MINTGHRNSAYIAYAVANPGYRSYPIDITGNISAVNACLLNVIDDYKRQVLWIETGTSLSALRVIRVLNQLKEVRGLPKMIRVDNGPEFISMKLDQWCKKRQIILVFIWPGNPRKMPILTV